MRLIQEFVDVDFFVDPKPLNDKEKKAISDFIELDKKNEKAKQKFKKARTASKYKLIK